MDPIRFQPIFKRFRWGGRRLATELGKTLGPESDYAESWEISTHGEDQSIVASGPLQGRSLDTLADVYGHELFGAQTELSSFPLLVKFLDATDRLSVQVHPDNYQARTFDRHASGKTEAWVIIDAPPDAILYAGLKREVDAHVLWEALERGDVEPCLHALPVKAGDCLLIPAGIVHSITEGLLIAEVQQSSDLKFRLHDWDRVDTNGQARPLQTVESFQCINFAAGPVELTQPVPLPGGGEEVLRCEYFTIHRHTVQTSGDSDVFIADDTRFHVVMLLKGEARLITTDNSISLRAGDTLLLPAYRDSTRVRLNDDAILLDVFVPFEDEDDSDFV